MNEHTLVAVYDTADQANAAVRDLEAANVPARAISRHAKNGSVSGATSTGMDAPVREKGFWASLFGGEPDYDTSVHDRSIDSGSKRPWFPRQRGLPKRSAFARRQATAWRR